LGQTGSLSYLKAFARIINIGQISFFTNEQKAIFDQVKQSDFLKSNFYFTGGPALSEFYLQHRYSDDLDFFSENKIDQQIVLTLMTEWSKQLDDFEMLPKMIIPITLDKLKNFFREKAKDLGAKSVEE